MANLINPEGVVSEKADEELYSLLNAGWRFADQKVAIQTPSEEQGKLRELYVSPDDARDFILDRRASYLSPDKVKSMQDEEEYGSWYFLV